MIGSSCLGDRQPRTLYSLPRISATFSTDKNCVMWQDQTTQCSCLNGEVNCGNWLIDDHLYSAILRSLEQTHCACMWFYMSDKLFIACFFNIHRSGVLTALAWLVLHETGAISAQVLCTPYNHAPCHFMQSHIRKVYVSLAVTCHLHFWQNDRDLLRATAVMRGWNGYWN